MAGLLAANLTGAAAAYAQPAASPESPTIEATAQSSSMKWLSIGVTAVVGAAWYFGVIPAFAPIVLGAVGGGVAGYLQYDANRQHAAAQ